MGKPSRLPYFITETMTQIWDDGEAKQQINKSTNRRAVLRKFCVPAFEDCVLMIEERVSKGKKREGEKKKKKPWLLHGWGATKGTRVTATGGMRAECHRNGGREGQDESIVTTRWWR